MLQHFDVFHRENKMLQQFYRISHECVGGGRVSGRDLTADKLFLARQRRGMMISMKSSIGHFLYGHHSRSYSSILPFLFTPSLPNISSSANSTSCLFVSAIVFKTRYYCRSHYLLANFPFHSCCFSSQITPDNHLHPLHPD